ncbi:unnamed protein product [Heligmosomoides polygyrus]|uniref:Uncharacterized protein n=1 Tax=Heligmosomoides polygyrus TaxID=6339 RepID=A0A3P7X5B3_HELPZ|nr:unnamed protein product [Heligmosomoides polygyrus]
MANMKHVLRVPKTVDCVQNILTVIPLQLMSYHVAELNGYNLCVLKYNLRTEHRAGLRSSDMRGMCHLRDPEKCMWNDRLTKSDFELDEVEKLEVVEEEDQEFQPEMDCAGVTTPLTSEGTITFSGGQIVSEEKAPVTAGGMDRGTAMIIITGPTPAVSPVIRDRCPTPDLNETAAKGGSPPSFRRGLSQHLTLFILRKA